MNNPQPASSASLSLQQPTVGPGDPAELRVRMTDRLLADDGMAIRSAAVAPWRSALATSDWPTLPARSPRPAGSATSEGAGA